MATGTRLSADFIVGSLPTALADNETEITLPIFEHLPVVTTGQFLTLSLSPDLGPDGAEIVHVVEHTNGSDTVTVQRGQENTTPKVHSSMSVLASAPTAGDFVRLGQAANITFNNARVGSPFSSTTVEDALYEVVQDVGVGYVTLATSQVITGVKTFTPQQVFTAGISFGTGWASLSSPGNNVLEVAGGFRPNSSGVRDLGGTSHFWRSGYFGGSAAVVPLVARGGASQTADLQQWQSSASTVLVKIDSAGNLWGGGAVIVGTTGSVTNNGMLHVQAPTASSRVASFQGFASQTANLTEWQSSAGAILARVGSDGAFYLSNAVTNTIGTAIGAAMLSITSGGASYSPLKLRGAASQSADFIQFQNSSGTVKSGVNSGGSWYSMDGGGYFKSGAGAAYSVYAEVGSAAHPGVVIKGAASQTAHLTEWRNSADSLYAYVDASGNFRGPTMFASTGVVSGYYGEITGGGGQIFLNPAATNNGAVMVEVRSAANKGLIVKSATSQTGSLTEWQTSTGNVIAAMDPNGVFQANAIGAAPWTNGSATPASAYVYMGNFADGKSFQFFTNLATNKGIVVTGHASQTADLQQWQNSAGTVLASVNESGYFVGGRFRSSLNQASVFGGTAISGTILTVGTAAPANVGLAVKAVASQTGNLTEWQNSAGTVLAKVDYLGGITSTTGVTTPGLAGNVVYNATTANAWFLMASTSATVGVALFRGAASQSADYLQIQKSDASRAWGFKTYAGTVPTHALEAHPVATSTYPTFQMLPYASNIFTMSAGTYFDGTDWRNSTDQVSAYITVGGSGFSYYSSAAGTAGGLTAAASTRFSVDNAGRMANHGVDSGAALRISTLGTTRIGIRVRGAASQTADLQTWENSSGTVLARVTSAGIMQIPGIFGATGSAYLDTTAGFTLTANTAAQVPWAVKGFASQTGDLTQWQNSATTVLAKLNNNGALVFPAGTNTAHGIVIGDRTGTMDYVLYSDVSKFRIYSGSADLYRMNNVGTMEFVNAGTWQTTVGAAGAASALPATPTKYLKVIDDTGATLVVAAYAAA